METNLQRKESYLPYSRYLKDKFGEKVYKLPINLPGTCPNRDGHCGVGGCIYCTDVGVGFDCLPNTVSILEQININREYIGKRYGSQKFIVYFQNYTNTYLSLDSFAKVLEQVPISQDIVGVSISTRPDCIGDEYLELLKKFSMQRNIDIEIELGLQSVNPTTLKIINRGHGVEEFIDAVDRIKRFGFFVITHVILDLPWDSIDDTINCSVLLTKLGVNCVKIHSLYIIKGTKIAEMYENREFQILTAEEYVNRVTAFLEYLDPNISIGRLVGRAPKENSIHVNWGMSWWRLKDMIEENMWIKNTCQGKKLSK